MKTALFGVGLLVQVFGMALVVLMLVAQIRSDDAYVGMAAIFIGLPMVLLSTMIAGLIVTYGNKLPVAMRQRFTTGSKAMAAITLFAGCALFLISARP